MLFLCLSFIYIIIGLIFEVRWQNEKKKYILIKENTNLIDCYEILTNIFLWIVFLNKKYRYAKWIKSENRKDLKYFRDLEKYLEGKYKL